MHVRRSAFQHLDTKILVIFDSGGAKAAAAAAMATASLAHLAIELVLEPKNR